jgi:hypothetical protein
MTKIDINWKNKYATIYNRLLLKLTLLSYCCLAFLPFSIFSQVNECWHASPATIDKMSKLKPLDNYEEDKVPQYTLPDILTTSNGFKVSKPTEWIKYRRSEILELFTTQVYGRVPITPYKKSIKVVGVDRKAMNGAATLKLIDITITAQAKLLTIHLGLFVPNKAKKPVPAFLLICNREPENIDFSRTKKSEFWPAEEIVARGYAVAAFYNGDIDPDVDDNFKDGIHGLLDIQRTSESWGTLAAWAWGASRCMDYLVTDNDIAHNKVAVVGHSRGGKTALWAGATDNRFALIISNDAGRGGTSLARRQYGETVKMINDAFPHWFCENFKNYNNKEDLLPVDWHMLMALIAPRALYVSSADEDLRSDPYGQYLSLLESVPVYKLFDKKNNLSKEMPPLETPVHGGQVAYHIRVGKHNLLLKDWDYFMDYTDSVFKRN